MFPYAAIPLTCWLCTLLATPRKPLYGNEVAELVYTRLLGRQQVLRLLAIVATAAVVLMMILTLPSRADSLSGTHQSVHVSCMRPAGASFPTCYRRQADGMWAQETLQDDGTWTLIATVPAPDSYASPIGKPDRSP